MEQALQQAFDRITGLQLTRTTRHEEVQYFHFGSTHYTTPQGLVLDIGEVTLAVNCPWQLQQPDGNTIRHSEVFMRKREEGLPTPVWDWKKPGSSLRDQRLMALVNEGPMLVAERVEAQENFGFTLRFANNTTLTVSPDPAKPNEEYWQLFSNTGDGFKVGAGISGVSGL